MSEVHTCIGQACRNEQALPRRCAHRSSREFGSARCSRLHGFPSSALARKAVDLHLVTSRCASAATIQREHRCVEGVGVSREDLLGELAAFRSLGSRMLSPHFPPRSSLHHSPQAARRKRAETACQLQNRAASMHVVIQVFGACEQSMQRWRAAASKRPSSGVPWEHFADLLPHTLTRDATLLRIPVCSRSWMSDSRYDRSSSRGSRCDQG